MSGSPWIGSMHSTKFSTSVLLVTVTVSWSEIRRVCPAFSPMGTVRTTQPTSCGSAALTVTLVPSMVRSGFETPDTSPAAAGGGENPTAEASSATAADTAAIRPATDRARMIPDLTNIPPTPSPPGLRAVQPQRSRPCTTRSGDAGRKYKRMDAATGPRRDRVGDPLVEDGESRGAGAGGARGAAAGAGRAGSSEDGRRRGVRPDRARAPG